MDQAEKKIFLQNLKDKPELFFTKILKCKQLWDGQRKILDALKHHKKVAVGSGHALGKDYLAGGLVPWFLLTNYPSKVIQTAPTDRQIESIMMAELASHYENAGGRRVLGGNLMSRKLVFDSKDWFSVAFTTRESKVQVGKFQGFHSPNILVIVSEAQAVDDSIYEQIEAVLTSDNCKLLLIGNPLRNTGYFAKALRGSEFKSIHLSCLDTPNYKERREVIPGIASYNWVEGMRKKYGEDSAIWQARVLGIVPDNPIDNVISYASAQAAVKKPLPFDCSVRRIIANDPACFGDDECVLYVMREGEIIEAEIFGKKSTSEIAGRIIILIRKHDALGAAIDSIGEGRGVADNLVDANVVVIEVKGSHATTKPNEYQNLRAEMWFFGRECFEKGICSIPDDDLLIEELTETKYFVNIKGVYQIEEKDDIKARLGRSSNRADAYLTGLWAIHHYFKKEERITEIYPQDGYHRVEPLNKSKSNTYGDISVTLELG